MMGVNTRRLVAHFIIGSFITAGAALAEEGAANIGSYSWTNIRPTVPFDPVMWEPRAGLRALELRNDLYVLGGRGPFSFETGTPIYGDVWKSSDLGMTWSKTVQWNGGNDQTMWKPRAYFGAVS